jgi:hypothetical protein
MGCCNSRRVVICEARCAMCGDRQHVFYFQCPQRDKADNTRCAMCGDRRHVMLSQCPRRDPATGVAGAAGTVCNCPAHVEQCPKIRMKKRARYL